MGFSKETKWFSINIDDSTSELMPSFETAINNKSLYIVKRSYHHDSVSGQTNYYQYDFYSLEGEKIQLKIGNCKIVGEIVERWKFPSSFDYAMRLTDYDKNIYDWVYPFYSINSDGHYCFLKISDDEGVVRTIGFMDFKNTFWQFFKEFSRAGKWERFFLSNWLKMISSKIESNYNSLLKFGYSKTEYGYEYGWIGKDEIIAIKNYFNSDLKLIQEVLDFCLSNFESKYLEEKKYSTESIEDMLDFATKILKGKKPWRKYISKS